MKSAREALRDIQLTDDELTELGRIESAVATAMDEFRGVPPRLEIFVSEEASKIAAAQHAEAAASGKATVPFSNFFVNPKLIASVDRLICLFKYRRQQESWSVEVVPDKNAYGDLVGYVLTLEPSFSACLPEVAAKADKQRGGAFPVAVAASSPWFGEEFALPKKPVLSVIFGTYNRIDHLQRAVASVRRSARRLDYEIVVCDGGSTDGSREWLAAQPDIILVGERRLEGATKAFNQCYGLTRGEFIANLNDDCVVQDEALAEGVKYLQEHPKAGQVAFGFRGGGEEWHVNEIYEPKTYPEVKWPTTYANFGITRREVADKAIYICGGFWNPIYRTYAADCELSAWVWKLGYRVDKLPDLHVVDTRADDPLRASNNKNSGIEAKRMYARWPADSFKPNGPDPRVTAEELARFRDVVDGKVDDQAKAEPDLLVQFVEMVGWPAPEEERRLRKISAAIRDFDPVEGSFPRRARALTPERVLHVSMGTDVDPQAGQTRALRKLGEGDYREVRWYADYEDPTARRAAILAAAKSMKPTLVFAQLQSASAVDAETVRQIRDLADPSCVIATWNGDVASENSPWTVEWQGEVGRLVDLTLHSSMSHVRALRAAGVHNAAYLQIGYDEEQYKPDPKNFLSQEQMAILSSGGTLPERSYKYDACFLGSRYGKGDGFARSLRKHDAAMRDEAVDLLIEALGPRFGVFGNGWGEGSQVIPLSRAHEAYWQSKIGLNVSLANYLSCYTSDRLHRILGCRALLLTKRFPMMSTYGLKHGENCLIWDTPQEARDLALDVLKDSERLMSIAAAGNELARKNMTWDVRVLELIPYLEAVRSVR